MEIAALSGFKKNSLGQPAQPRRPLPEYGAPIPASARDGLDERRFLLLQASRVRAKGRENPKRQQQK
jgi:hypothetical protein